MNETPIDSPLTSVHQLKDAGFKLKVSHLRFYSTFNDKSRKLDYHLLTKWAAKDRLSTDNYKYGLEVKGGMTIIEVEKDNVHFRAEGVCSNNDAFVKKMGIVCALNQLEKTIKLQEK